MNKIWIVTELFYPDETSTAFILTKIAQRLSEKSQISIICGPEGYTTASKLQFVHSLTFPVHRVSKINLNKDKFFQRILRVILISFKLFASLTRRLKKHDKVLIVTNPPLLLVLISILKLFKRFEFIIIVHDVFPENTIPASILTQQSLLYKILKKITDSAYKKADNLIALGEDMSTLLKQKTENKVPIKVIPNWADTINIQPIERFDRFLSKDPSTKIVIQFAGNIGRVQGLYRFLKMISHSNHGNYHLNIIGDGAEKTKLIDLIDSNRMSYVTIKNSFKRSDQQKLLNECDIALITLEKGMYGLGVPSKFYNILSAGKPTMFIGDKGSEIAKVVQENEIGYAFNWDEEEKILSFLNDLSFEVLESLILMGQRARKLAENYYSEKRILDLYANAI